MELRLAALAASDFPIFLIPTFSHLAEGPRGGLEQSSEAAAAPQVLRFGCPGNGDRMKRIVNLKFAVPGARVT